MNGRTIMGRGSVDRFGWAGMPIVVQSVSQSRETALPGSRLLAFPLPATESRVWPYFPSPRRCSRICNARKNGLPMSRVV